MIYYKSNKNNKKKDNKTILKQSYHFFIKSFYLFYMNCDFYMDMALL